jgi:hypothetical protein
MAIHLSPLSFRAAREDLPDAGLPYTAEEKQKGLGLFHLKP